jgi:hypothetical protein
MDFMGHARQEHQEEQQRVNQVIRAIDRQIAADHSQAARSKKEMMKIRRNFWEDVRVNIDDPGEAAETAISIKQQAEVLSDRERCHRQAQNQLMTLERSKNPLGLDASISRKKATRKLSESISVSPPSSIRRTKISSSTIGVRRSPVCIMTILQDLHDMRLRQAPFPEL